MSRRGLRFMCIHPKEPKAELLQKAPRDEGFIAFGAAQFWAVNNSFFPSISFWTRVPMIALTALLGVVIFSFTRKLFGDVAAVISVAFFTLEPTILAHGRII